MRKIIALILSLSLIICEGSVYAIEAPEDSFVDNDPAEYELIDNVLYITVSEYDIYLYNLEQEKTALRAAGYTESAIEKSRTFEVENKILERAQLSAETLASYGYNHEQIEILKSYDGRALEAAPEMRNALPYMYATLSSGSCTTQNIIAHLNWEWSAAPVIYAYDDVIAVRFRAVKPDGNRLEGVCYNPSFTNSYVSYYNYSTNNLMSVTATQITTSNALEHVETSFSRPDSSLSGYAKSGSFNCYIYVPANITANIAFGSFIFAYAFTKTTASYSIGYPASFSITIGTGADTALYTQVIINSDGTLTEYRTT